MSAETKLTDFADSDANADAESDEEHPDIDVGHPNDPNTVDTSETCTSCGTSISERSQALLDEQSCLFCKGDDDE